MAHRMFRLAAKSVGLVADQSDDHAVQVEKEHQEVETEFDERFLCTGKVSERSPVGMT